MNPRLREETPAHAHFSRTSVKSGLAGLKSPTATRPANGAVDLSPAEFCAFDSTYVRSASLGWRQVLEGQSTDLSGGWLVQSVYMQVPARWTPLFPTTVRRLRSIT